MASLLHPCTWNIKSEPVLKSYDFIVCGAGSAVRFSPHKSPPLTHIITQGCALASRLSEDPNVSVLLLEAGGNGLALDARIPAACGKLQKTEMDWSDYAEEQPSRASIGLYNGKSYWPRGKGLGGSSLINYMAYVRGKPADFDSWAEQCQDERWSFANCLPAFLRIEQVLGLQIRQPVQPIAADFLQAVERCGYTVGDYNGKEQAGLHRQSVKNGARCSSADAYLWNNGAHKRANLHIVCHALVHHIKLDSQQRAVAVEFSLGSSSVVRTVNCKREIILSCSAVGTPCVLLRSGIGPKDELAAMGIQCVVNNPHVGKHLQDHLAVLQLTRQKAGKQMLSVNTKRAEGSIFPAVEWALHGTGLLASSAYDASLFYSPHGNKRCEAQIGVFVSPANHATWENNIHVPTQGYVPKDMLEDDAEGAILVPTLLHPHSRGSVELTSNKPGDKPKITANYLLDERDFEAMVDVCVESARIAKQMDLAGEICKPQDLQHLAADSRELWEQMTRRYGTTLYHPTSTCRIGSVVDSSLKVQQIKGLRCCDASVMPHITSGNTNAPSIMIGERCAEFIAQEHGLKLQHGKIPAKM